MSNNFKSNALKLAQFAVIAATLSVAGCSTMKNAGSTVSNSFNSLFSSGEKGVKQVLKDPRADSVYDTSGFAFSAEGASENAVRNAQVVCKNKPLQVISDNPKSMNYEESGEQKTVYIVDMSYRCGKG